MKTVVIDAGHGGKFFGATNKSRKEKDFNLATAWAVYHYLNISHKDKNIACMLTRYHDSELADKLGSDLRRRVEIANRTRANLFVSIHADSTGEEHRETASGFTVYSMPESRKGNLCAVNMAGVMGRTLPDRRNRGIGTKAFYVLRETKMPAILVECGFLSHPEESKWLFENIVLIAEAVGDGIIKSLEVI